MPDTDNSGFDDGEAFTTWRPDHPPWPQQIAALINDARRRRGVAVAQLAYRARFSDERVERILRGHESPTLSDVARLCAALGIRLEPPAVDRLPA